MHLKHSFRIRLFAGFLLASLLRMLLCSTMLLQIFRLRLESQASEESQEHLNHITESLDCLYTRVCQTTIALKASPYIVPALASEQRESSMIYNELYGITEGSRANAQFDLYDEEGNWLYSTKSTPAGHNFPTRWGVLYSASQTDSLAFSQVDGGEGNGAPLFQGAVQLTTPEGTPVGYLVVTMTRADFQRLLDGTYGVQNDLLLLDRHWRPVYASQTELSKTLAPRLRDQLLTGEPLGTEGEEFFYPTAFQEEMGLYVILRRPQALNQGTKSLLTTVTAGSALVCILLSILMSLRLSRQMFQPIQQFHRAIGEVVHNVSVNMSYMQLRRPEIQAEVLSALQDSDMPGNALTIEVTESMELQEYGYLNALFDAWKNEGVEISVDDFGTGYSSLGWLKKLSIDEIKIGRCFVKGIRHSAYNQQLLSNIIEVAKGRLLRVCCEGVETIEELEVLESLQPDLYQGFFFSKPIPPESFSPDSLQQSFQEQYRRAAHVPYVDGEAYEDTIMLEHAILKKTENSVIMCDVDTHELCYLNPAAQRIFGVRNYQGKNVIRCCTGEMCPVNFAPITH